MTPRFGRDASSDTPSGEAEVSKKPITLLIWINIYMGFMVRRRGFINAYLKLMIS
jgi:hypothetical protein